MAGVEVNKGTGTNAEYTCPSLPKWGPEQLDRLKGRCMSIENFSEEQAGIFLDNMATIGLTPEQVLGALRYVIDERKREKED